MELKNEILKKQIKKLAPSHIIEEEWQPLFMAIDRIYEQLYSEVHMLESITNEMVDNLTDANKNLERINESLDGFNYHVSHDLKSRFMNTQSLVMILNKYLELPNSKEKIKEICKKLEWNSYKAIETVNEFLEISRLDYEKETKKIELCDLKKIINTEIESINGMDRKFVKIDLSAFNHLSFEPISLSSIIRNLLTNAFKYKKEGKNPNVEIKTSFNFEHPIITISDDGIGLNSEKYGNQLFKPFSRFNSSKFIEGNGVGLFLIRKAIESGGGSVSLVGKENEGVTVTLKFKKDAVRQE